mgnify:CR=1 FL=1
MKKLYTGIDIGTYHVKVVIAAPPESSDIPMQILGTGIATSKGMRHGYIIDKAEAAQQKPKDKLADLKELKKKVEELAAKQEQVKDNAAKAEKAAAAEKKPEALAEQAAKQESVKAETQQTQQDAAANGLKQGRDEFGRFTAAGTGSAVTTTIALCVPINASSYPLVRCTATLSGASTGRGTRYVARPSLTSRSMDLRDSRAMTAR